MEKNMILKHTKDYQILMPLYEIRLSVTGACNQNCIYCGPFVDGKHAKGYGMITLKQIQEFVGQLKEFINKQNIHIQITGGEPTLRKDLVEIFALLNQEIKDIGMTTNGSGLNLKIAKDLIKNGLSDIHIHLPSLDKDVCEKTTRARFDKNSLQNILDSALLIKAMGGRVEFNTPVTNINKSTLPDLFNFCYKNKINLKLIEELRLNDSLQISVSSIKDILDDWIEDNKIDAIETKIKNRYGIIYNLDDNFFFRIAPVDEEFKNSLIGSSKKILLDGRYWVGGHGNLFLFTPAYSLSPVKGTINDLERQIKNISKKYKETIK